MGNPMKTAKFDFDISEGPEEGEAYWVNTADNIRIRIAIWNKSLSESGTILVFPGRGDCAEKFGRVASNFAKNGFTTLVVDWRGQGLSERLVEDPLVGHVNRFSDYQLDVSAVVDAAKILELPEPWYLIGHSMGACIGLRSLQNGLPVNACTFTAPMWDIKISPMQRIFAWPLSWAAKAIGQGHCYVPGNKTGERKSYVLSVGFEDNRLTNDRSMYQYMVNIATNLPDCETAAPSLGWLHEVLKECRSLSKELSPDMPCMTFCGDDDVLVDMDAAEKRMASWTEGTFEVIRNSKHDIMSETEGVREAVINRMCDFFKCNT